MNLDLQWLFYDRACNISIIPVPKIYLNKSEKALNLQDVFVIVNVCVIQIAVLRETIFEKPGIQNWGTVYHINDLFR